MRAPIDAGFALAVRSGWCMCEAAAPKNAKNPLRFRRDANVTSWHSEDCHHRASRWCSPSRARRRRRSFRGFGRRARAGCVAGSLIAKDRQCSGRPSRAARPNICSSARTIVLTRSHQGTCITRRLSPATLPRYDFYASGHLVH